MKMKKDALTGKDLYLDLDRSDILAVYQTVKIPLDYSISGYGKKLPTRFVIKTTDKRLHRVYCICYSNSGSLWMNYQKKKPMVESAILDYEIETGIHNKDFPFIKM